MKEENFTIERTPLNAPSLSELKAKKVILPETPCDNCWTSKEEDCKSKEIACPDFVHYINKGIIRDEERIPDRDNFLKINPHLKDIVVVNNNIETMEGWTTLQKELKLLNKLRIVSLQEIEKYFENKTTLEKVKIACITYGLVLKADSFTEQK